MIRNMTRKTIIARKQVFCVSERSKTHGLMFSSRKAVEDTATILVFAKSVRISLHMWFVFYSIDVIFLDDQYKVVDLKKNFFPFTLSTSKKPAAYALEARSGTIAASKTRLGDTLSFETGLEGAYAR